MGVVRLVRAVVAGLRSLLGFCLGVGGVHCLDPPLFTSYFLRRRGFSEYDVRRVWAEARAVQGSRFLLYDCCNARYWLEVMVSREASYHYLDGTPVDYIDCNVLRGRCVEVTHSNTFRAYVSGVVEGNSVRMNIAYLSVLAARLDRAAVETALEALEELAEGGLGGVDAVERLLTSTQRLIAMGGSVLGRVLPRTPRSLEELLRVSPLARRLAARLPQL